MTNTVAAAAAGRHLERLAHVRPAQAKAHFNKIETQPTDWQVLIGAAVTRAFQLAGVSQKEAAAAINRNVAQISRWCSGQERPQFDALFAVEALRVPLVIALAGLIDGVAVETTIHVRRPA